MSDQETDLILFLKALFRPGELIGLQLDVFNTKVGTVEEHMASDFWNWKYACINPLDGSGFRRTGNVTEFRNFIIERDDGLSVSDQVQWADEIQLPYSTAVHSGNKSVHFTITLQEGVDYNTYKHFCHGFRKRLPEIDAHCLQPVGLTRVPCWFENQILLKRNGVYPTPAELERYLGVGSAVEKEEAQVAGAGRYTMRAQKHLNGLSLSSTAHADALHTVKVLLDQGFTINETCDIMKKTRQAYLPDEGDEARERKVLKLINWVSKAWKVVKNRP